MMKRKVNLSSKEFSPAASEQRRAIWGTVFGREVVRFLDGQLEGDVHLSFFSQRDDF